MFKDGSGYYTCCNMGAGAFLAGTTTSLERKGNRYGFIRHPFLPYPNSGAASNWMGLPNKSHHNVAKKLSEYNKISGCPIGVSLAFDPDVNNNEEKIRGLIEGLEMYDKAGVDFIEVNFSCPNVASHSDVSDSNDIELSQISERFLKKRSRNLPVIAKYSNDISPEIINKTIDNLIDLGYDGINIGNTSTNYRLHIDQIHRSDIKNYRLFTERVGGGLSGSVLKQNSLELCKLAVSHIKTRSLTKEFHCIRTGGIDCGEDILLSQSAGVYLNQWFSGFFDRFADDGFGVYRELLVRR